MRCVRTCESHSPAFCSQRVSPTVGHLSKIVGTFGKQKFREAFSFPYKYNGYKDNQTDDLEREVAK
jgi:hypothetical protein